MAHLATQVHFWPRIQDNRPLFPQMDFAKFIPKISFYLAETNLSLWVDRVRGLQTRTGDRGIFGTNFSPIFRLEFSFKTGDNKKMWSMLEQECRQPGPG